MELFGQRCCFLFFSFFGNPSIRVFLSSGKDFVLNMHINIGLVPQHNIVLVTLFLYTIRHTS